MSVSPVTIASVRAHGVRQLLVYCQGKREGDWPCHIKASCWSRNSAQMIHCLIFNAAADARDADGVAPIW